MTFDSIALVFYLPGMSNAKKKLQIRPELIGAAITTKKHPTKIVLDGSKEVLELCKKLDLDVFITETTKEAQPAQEGAN